MRKFLLTIVLAVLAGAAQAADITGQWQGTVHAGKDMRVVLKLAAKDGGGFDGQFYNIDQSPNGLAVSDIAIDGAAVRFKIAQAGGSFDGTLSPDGQAMVGKLSLGFALPLTLDRATDKTAWAIQAAADTSPHKVQFVTSDDGVKLEVLDWGGSGRPLVFLAGLGASAHVFDNFAPQFSAGYHVYGVTRRGYGASDKPVPTAANYTADRLGDDLLAVMDALKIEKPVLAGWSMGGEEMGSLATRHPERVAGLIYLDAAYAYAFYAPGNQVPVGGNLAIDANQLRHGVDVVNGLDAPVAQKLKTLDAMMETGRQLQTDLVATRKILAQLVPPTGAPPNTPQVKITLAILGGMEKFTALKAPVLAIFSVPHAVSSKAPAAVRANLAVQDAATEAQAKRFAAANPTARVVRLANSQHDVFNSNPADVTREMNAFLEHLP
jgi:pimeloyl-ACP methyl ester carboxylesterase